MGAPERCKLTGLLSIAACCCNDLRSSVGIDVVGPMEALRPCDALRCRGWSVAHAHPYSANNSGNKSTCAVSG